MTQPNQTAKTHKILVVEDEGLIAHDISNRLRALGHEVIAVASTAEEALEHAPGADLVLMDIRIDGTKDGIAAAAEIRERFHVPVVFLTAHADRATLDRAKGAEPFGYIVKPLAHSSLNTSIEIALYKHGMERQLEEREAWLRTILASIADAAIVTDTEGRVLMLNRAAETLTGVRQQDAQGQPLAKVARLMEFDSEDDTADPVALAILRDAPVALERNWKLIARNGREAVIEGAVAPVKIGEQSIGAVVSFRDVSARRWEERQVRQSQKLDAAGRLAAGVSNDYANLLAVIRSQADQLVLQFGEYSPARKAAEEIRQAAAAAEQMNQRLAAFGTRQVSQPEVLSLNALVRKLAKLIASVVESKPWGSIELAIRPAATAGRIKADAEQMEQAIMTLIVHACNTMHEQSGHEQSGHEQSGHEQSGHEQSGHGQGGPGQAGPAEAGHSEGRLLIETANLEIPSQGHMHNYVMLAISYTGHEHEPEKLFEPAAAGEESLSLSMVHAIVAEHGGLISAQATAGGGTRFEMLLPHHEGAALVPRPAEGATPAILLVEGREQVRLQLHNFFEANGYNLLEAADASEAAAIAEMHEGSLDLLIAETEQAEAIEAELRKSRGTIALLRIVSTPEPGPDEIRRPFTQQALLDRVAGLLRSREAASAGAP